MPVSHSVLIVRELVGAFKSGLLCDYENFAGGSFAALDRMQIWEIILLYLVQPLKSSKAVLASAVVVQQCI